MYSTAPKAISYLDHEPIDYRDCSQEGGLVEALSDPSDLQARRIAETIQRVNPDVILINEFNFDARHEAADLFSRNFLAVAQNVTDNPDGPAPAVKYPFQFLAESNTGIHSGFDLDNDGRIDTTPGDGTYGNDAFGFGEFPGRYGMLLLSKFPIRQDAIRTFQKFPWKHISGALLPDDPASAEPADWYSANELDAFRLSSKSHWDVPIEIGGQLVHVLASHPTPPVFDGPEDRNGRRNHDEIRLWADYISPDTSNYLVDDKGITGGLNEADSFVVMGDLNADPNQGDSLPGAINQLLDHPRVNNTVTPVRALNGNARTSTFGLRVDYVLPSADIEIHQAEVFWPSSRGPLRGLLQASDHRLVWADLRITPVPEPTSGWALLVLLCGLGRWLGSNPMR